MPTALLQRLLDKYAQTAPALVAWAEENLAEGLTIFAFPEAHRRRLRTTNMVERLNKEVKRRTSVATLFPNEASCLRLVTRRADGNVAGVGDGQDVFESDRRLNGRRE